MHTDTIVAIATPRGHGGIGVIRVSGSNAAEIAAAFLGRSARPRQVYYRAFMDGAHRTIDTGLLLFFSAPGSFTGEDVTEIHAHGSPVALDLLVKRILELGARPARPGEFTERAFLNGKIDLVQAEAIQGLITASSVQAARAAQRSLQGEFSRKVSDLVEALTQLRMFVELALDFSDEEINFLESPETIARVEELEARVATLMDQARGGRLLHDGFALAIVGPPNAGKSSLLNRLVERDAAIVSPYAGTTRDVVRERFLLAGVPVSLVDTAGLRSTEDSIELEGIQRAHREIAMADHLLLVVDDTNQEDALAIKNRGYLPETRAAITVVHNKIDLTGRQCGLIPGSEPPAVALSASTGDGMDALLAQLSRALSIPIEAEDCFGANARHIEALRISQTALSRAAPLARARENTELLAEELKLAQESLSEITGRFTSDELLGRIFSTFCIGK